MPTFDLYLEFGAKDGWCLAHCPDLPGVGFKSPSREVALALAPFRLAAELAWAGSAGIAVPVLAPAADLGTAGVGSGVAGFSSGATGVGSGTAGVGSGATGVGPGAAGATGAQGRGVEVPTFGVGGEVTGDNPVASGDTEATFAPDLGPLDQAYLDYVLAYVRASRRTLLDLADRLGPALADWRPAEGKRTIGEVLGHVADAEAFYAVRLEDPARPAIPARPSGSPTMAELWKHYAGRDLGLGPAERLARTRELVVDRLGRLNDDDRRRVIESRGETWTARKVLRRLAWHERYHTRQIETWLAP